MCVNTIRNSVYQKDKLLHLFTMWKLSYFYHVYSKSHRHCKSQNHTYKYIPYLLAPCLLLLVVVVDTTNQKSLVSHKNRTWIWVSPRIDTVLLFGLVGRVFANGPEGLGSIPGPVIPKTLKMVLDTSLLNTQQYKVYNKGKVEHSRERSSTLPYTSV